MYVQGVSTRKMKAISEELCCHEFSASAVSQINKALDANRNAFCERRLGAQFDRHPPFHPALGLPRGDVGTPTFGTVSCVPEVCFVISSLDFHAPELT
jgi:hypothetical protein